MGQTGLRLGKMTSTKALPPIWPFWASFDLILSQFVSMCRHIRRKFLFYKKLSNFAQTLTYFYHILPYQKKKKSKFVSNKIFVPILTFFCIRPYYFRMEFSVLLIKLRGLRLLSN